MKPASHVPCRRCGNPIAPHASKCPNCGTNTPNKQTLRAIYAVISLLVVLCGSILALAGFVLANISVPSEPSRASTSATPETSADEKIPTFHLVSPGSVIDRGGYVLFEGLHIYYDGETFTIKNNREDVVRLSVWVVGVKADGSYEYLQRPAFYGVDEAQYQKDLDENGWAVEDYTNMIRPGETLRATLHIYDYSRMDENAPPPDVDGDGYCDIVFCIHPQGGEDSVTVSTADPESDIYRLKAD